MKLNKCYNAEASSENSEPAPPQTGAKEQVSKFVHAEESPWDPSKNEDLGHPLFKSRTTPPCLTGTYSEYSSRQAAGPTSD